MAGGHLYTTADLPELECRVLAAARQSHPEQNQAVVSARVLEMAISVAEAGQGYELSGEQRSALTRLGSPTDARCRPSSDHQEPARPP